LRRNVEFYETKFIKSKDIDIYCINKDIVADYIKDLSNIEFYQELILNDIFDEIENTNNENNNNNEINENNNNNIITNNGR